MQLWKSAEYSSISSMPGFWVCKSCTRFWICLNMAGFWICLVNVSQGFASSSVYARAQHMVRLWIYEGYTGCWICLNNPEYALIMCQYAWNASICLNSAEYNWICRHIPEKTECWICQNSECVWYSA